MQSSESLIKHTEESRRAKLCLQAEIAGILLFLPGLVFLVVAICFLAMTFASVVLPEEIPEEQRVAQSMFDFGIWPILGSVLAFLLPAGFFMSAGVVLRYFLLRD